MDRDQLIAEVARTTGVRLDKSDPILAAAVVHEALLNETLVKLDRQVTVQADRVTAASTQAVLDAKKEAEALLSDAGEWLDIRMKAAGEAAATLVLSQIHQEILSVRSMNRILTRLVWIAAVCGLMVISGAIGLVLAELSH